MQSYSSFLKFATIKEVYCCSTTNPTRSASACGDASQLACRRIFTNNMAFYTLTVEVFCFMNTESTESTEHKEIVVL